MIHSCLRRHLYQQPVLFRATFRASCKSEAFYHATRHLSTALTRLASSPLAASTRVLFLPFSTSNSASTGAQRPRRRVPNLEERRKKVFIGNLYQHTTEDDLLAHLSSVGQVASIVIMRNHDGTSKRCALVEFKSKESAKQAVLKLNKSTLRKHVIVVRPDLHEKVDRHRHDRAVTLQHAMAPPVEKAQSSVDKDASAQAPSRIIGALVARSKSVFAGNFSPDLDACGLRQYFEDAGYDVVFAQVFKTRTSPPRSKCCGKVTFSADTKIHEVIEKLNGGRVLGMPILVKEDESKIERTFVKPAAGVRQSQSMHLTKSVRWHPEDKTLELVPLPPTEQGVEPSRSVYVSNLAFTVSHERLVQFIANDMIMSDLKMEEAVMKVKKVRFLLDARGQSRGRAFVEFEQSGDAEEAVARMHRTQLRGRDVYVRLMNEL